jgi:hypothetical protein
VLQPVPRRTFQFHMNESHRFRVRGLAYALPD